MNLINPSHSSSQQDSKLTGKVVLITGASRRIGAIIARHLHVQGMNLVLHYRQSFENARCLQAELCAHRPDSVILLQAELRDTAHLSRLVSQTIEHYGRLDVLINNASVFYPTPIGTVTENQWEELMGSNLKYHFFLSQAAAPYLNETGGCIINLIDIHAERPLKHHSVYCVSKAGLVMLTKSLAKELAPAIRVNAISPGAILWAEEREANVQLQDSIISSTALKRRGEPLDIARVVLFLIRDADYITGEVIAVDGGRTLEQ
jgi:pteridine reductase